MGRTSLGPAYLDGLNPEQREAVEHFEGPLLVLAGAGSGKTRVLTARVCRLVDEHGVPPDRILAVTFTNKAAGEMRERISRLLGETPAGIWVGTFHATGARILRRHAEELGWSRTFSIYDQEQSLREVKRAQERLDIDPRRWNPKAVRAEISAAKNQLVPPREYAEERAEGFDLFARTVARVYPEYQRALEEQNAFDFDDLLVKPVDLLESNPGLLERYRERFAFVLVDEYQDTNRAQFRFLELLAGERANLMVVGDDDQSIYGWRGADIRNILDFEKTYPSTRTIRLERNYRSTGTILEAANAVIAENRMRKGKTLRTERDAGEPIILVETADERDEAAWIVTEIGTRVSDHEERSYSDFAILYRTNAQSRALEDAFRKRGVPYQIVGGVRFYERREIQDLIAYLRLVSNPLDFDAFDRVVNYPRRGIGATSQERLASWAREHGIPPLEAATRAEEVPELTRGATQSLQAFAALIGRFSARAAHLPVGELIDELIDELDLYTSLRDEGPEGADRVENVRELVAAAYDFEAELVEEGEDLPDTFTELDLFLQQVALVTDIDRHDPEADQVTLMTLHNAKGLEFPVVFISGMEEGLFPLARAYDEPAQLEEERRLFYVGLTRARDLLFLTWARERRRGGDTMVGRLSTFAESIPDSLLRLRRSSTLSAGRGRWSRMGVELGGGGRRRSPREGDPEGEGIGFDPDSLDLNQDAPRFVRGERVEHPTFGSGAIVDVSGFGRDARVVVDFDSVGRKKLLVRYAGLERGY